MQRRNADARDAVGQLAGEPALKRSPGGSVGNAVAGMRLVA
jgi:hypothetical protein